MELNSGSDRCNEEKMADLSPIELCDLLEQRYVGYLTTSFAYRDPELRKSFHDALRRGKLTKGPFLQATPSFKPGNSLDELFEELVKTKLDSATSRALYGSRSLYVHQEKAIRKIAAGRNVVVSTGTGSGKTEAFLLPIAMHLFQQQQRDQLGPGVRAMILYPMNALANDQRDS